MARVFNPISQQYQEVSEAEATALGASVSRGTRQVFNPISDSYSEVDEDTYEFLSRPGQSWGDYAQRRDAAQVAPQTDEPEGVGFSDYAKGVMSGGASLVQGVGWLARQMGMETVGGAIEELGRDAVDYWHESMSDAARRELAREFVRKNEHGEYEWGDASLHTVGLFGAHSLLGTAAGMGAGAGVTKVLQAFANPVGRSALARAASHGSVQAARKLRLVDTVLGAGGFGVGEGAVGGISAGSSVYDQVMRLPPRRLLENERYRQIYDSAEGMPELERHQYAADTVAKEASTLAGFESGLTTALLGAPMGAFFGRLIGRTGRLGSTRLRASGFAAAGEAAQELAQSAAESAITQRAVTGEADFAELLNEALGGALAGAALGGTVGAATFRSQQGRQRGEAGAPDREGAGPDRNAPLRQAAMDAARAGAPRPQVLEVVQRARSGEMPILQAVHELRQMQRAAEAEPPPAEGATFAETVPGAPEEAADAAREMRAERERAGESAAVDEAAHEAATSPENELPEPTPAQIEADNYKQGHVRVGGLDITIENPAGSVRRGTDQAGRPWESELQHHYGKIRGTVGSDGDHLDVFLGPNPRSERVFVVNQLRADGSFDEHKVMVGFDTAEEAREAYLSNYEAGWEERVGSIEAVEIESFRRWAKFSDTTKGPLILDERGVPVIPQEPAAPETEPAAAPAEPSPDIPEGSEPVSLDRGSQFLLETGSTEEPEPDQVDVFVRPAVDGSPAVESVRRQQVGHVQVGSFRSGFDVIDSPSKAAHVMAPLRRRPQENMVALVTDARGRPLAVIRHTVGMTAASQVEPSILTGAVHNVPGAARVWWAHNHPTGDIRQSPQDRDITRLIHRAMQGTGVESMGMLVVGPGGAQASYYHPETELRDIDVGVPPGTPTAQQGDFQIEAAAGAAPPTPIPETERQFERALPRPERPVDQVGPWDIQRSIEEISGSESEPGVLLLDSRLQATGWVPMTADEMSRLRTGRVGTGASRLMQEIDATNARGIAVRVTRGAGADMRAARNVGTFAADLNVRMVDILAPTAEDGLYQSQMTIGRDLSGPSPYLSVRPSAGGMSVEEVTDEIGGAIERLRSVVDVRVVASTDELPDPSAPPDTEGAYFQDGRVYLVAGSLTPERLQEVFRHEVFGHMSMEREPGFARVLGQVRSSIRMGGLRRHVEEVRARQGNLDPDTEAREVLALMAERGVRGPVTRRLRSALSQFARRAGVPLEGVGEPELRGLMASAARSLERDAAVMRDYQAAAGVEALERENATDDEIIAALDRIYAGEDIDRHAGLYSRPAPASPEIQGILDRTMAPAPEELGVRDRLRGVWRRLTDWSADGLVQGVVDSANRVKVLEEGQFGEVLDASESAWKAVLATKNLPSVMTAVMFRGTPVYRNGTFQVVAGRKGPVEIFRPLTEHPDGNLLHQWELYAAAKRARGLLAQGREKLFTSSDILQIEALGAKYPVFDQVLADWEAFNHQVLDLAVDRGVLDADMVETWKENFYVPFYRAVGDVQGSQAPNPKGGLSAHGGQRVRRRLRGSEAPLGNVFENMMMNTAYLIDEAFKNTAMERIVQLAEGIGLERVPLRIEAVRISDDQIIRALRRAGLVVEGAEGKITPEQRKRISTLFRRIAPRGRDIVSVYRNGRPEYYQVSDDLLLRTIGNMGYDSFADVLGLFRGSKRLLTGAITIDPAFMLANWIRDTLSTWVVSGAPGMRPLVDAVRGARGAFAQDEDALAIMMAGGGGGGYYDIQPADLRKFLTDRLGSASAVRRFEQSIIHPRNILRGWRRIGQAAENANRVAVFRAVRAAGGSVAEAAYQARDVLNFTMSGDYAAMRWLVATVPFMNARIQGLYRLWRGAKDNPRAFAMKGMGLMAATMALLLRNNDRKEYEELPEWDRDTYWHFFVGGEHFRLPKPFEVGAIFATLPERMYRFGTARDGGDLVRERALAMVGETFAFNPIPQLAKPVIEQYANRSFFFGSPIVGLSEKNLRPEAQYTPWTSETMREMAEALPDWAPAWLRSPRRLEHAVRGYLGATGAYALSVADAATRAALGYPNQPARKIYDAPVVSRFWKDPSPRHTKYADQLYNMLDEANAVFRTINRYKAQGRLDEARALFEENRTRLQARTRLNRIATQVRKINDQSRRIMFSETMAPEEKRERLDALSARKNELVARVAPLADLF